MSYYWFNRHELFEKAKNRYHNGGGKKEAAEYYLKNREILKENANNRYRSLSEEEKKQKNIKQTYIKNRKANKKASQMSIK